MTIIRYSGTSLLQRALRGRRDNLFQVTLHPLNPRKNGRTRLLLCEFMSCWWQVPANSRQGLFPRLCRGHAGPHQSQVPPGGPRPACGAESQATMLLEAVAGVHPFGLPFAPAWPAKPLYRRVHGGSALAADTVEAALVKLVRGPLLTCLDADSGPLLCTI